VAKGPAIFLMNGQGQTRELYRLPAELARAGAECHEPRPLAARQREAVIPSRISAQQTTGKLILNDIYTGRRMEGVRRGQIRKLLVLETLPKPVNDSGKMPPISFLGTYTLERVLGTVPVEADGSAYMEVPALRTLFLVALDERDNSVKRIVGFTTVQPGETLGCVGCHEYRTQTAAAASRPASLALRRGPSRIEPIAGIPDVFDFPRDIQPILDKHCVSCHDYERGTGNPPVSSHTTGNPPVGLRRTDVSPVDLRGPRAGGVILSGDRGPIYSHSYYTLTALGYVSDGRDRLVANLPPRAIGTSASPLIKLLDGSHYAAKLSPHEIDTIRYWIESAAPYPGTYASIATGQIGGYPKSQLDTSDRKWPVSVAAGEAIGRRCGSCHDKRRPMPRYLSDDLGMVLQNPDDNDIRIRWSRHLFFNLSRPEKSLVLLAPLGKDAGGFGLCVKEVGARPVFADATDPDYQKILALCIEGKRRLEKIKRFDMPGFRPHPMYVREMKRFGILPKALGDDDPIDVYATDQAYWRSLWLRPGPQ
jgi:hypothetical protein